jgi:hypothetical protein
MLCQQCQAREATVDFSAMTWPSGEETLRLCEACYPKAEQEHTAELSVKHTQPMSNSYPVAPDHPLCGTWVAHFPEDTGDYRRAEYTISVVEGQFRVTGIDCSDNVEFIIKDIEYDGEWIRFSSQVPSTGRSGHNWVRIVGQDFEFRWVRKAVNLKVLPSPDA